MGDVIQLRSPIDLDTDKGRQFIVDATRAGEGVITDAELLERYELSSADLQNIAKDKAVARAVRDERERRVRTGVAAKELAAKFFVKSPGILDQIQNNENSPRHKIDAIRELRATASGGDGEGPTSQGEKFSIIINLGSDVGDRIEKTFDITPNKAKQLELSLGGEARWERMGLARAFSRSSLINRNESRRRHQQPPCQR